jgi:hypothetical protein
MGREERRDHELEEVEELSKNELHIQKEILHIVEKIWARLTAAQSATLTFVSEKGEPIMPARIVVGGAGAKALFTEFAGPTGTGAVVPPSGPISYASDNLAVATVDASGNVTAVGANADGSDATANISGLDPASANKVTASDVITVGKAAAAVAQSATLALTAN